MNGIVINIDPVIFQFGSIEFRWYSLAVILAVATAVLITARQAKKMGLAPEEISSLAVWVVIAGMAGARLFHVIDRWDYYAVNPLYIFQVQQGGLAIWGALVGGGVAAIAYARIRHIPIGRLADALVPALLIAQIIGRFGCIVNGDAYGGITDLPWGFIYSHPNALIPGNLFGMPTHPYPVYEIIWNGAVLLTLLRLRHKLNKEGLLFLSYLSFYSLGRFVLSFVRLESAVLWELQQAQVLAIAMLIASVTAIVYLFRKTGRELISESEA